MTQFKLALFSLLSGLLIISCAGRSTQDDPEFYSADEGTDTLEVAEIDGEEAINDDIGNDALDELREEVAEELASEDLSNDGYDNLASVSVEEATEEDADLNTESAYESPVQSVTRKPAAIARTKVEQPAEDSQPLQVVANAPEIPKDAIASDDKKLNRFYFIRPGDTPETVSQLIYGNDSYAAELLSNVGGTNNFQPGKHLYYTSPDDPNDTSMQSFYFERSVKPATISAIGGETLAQLADDFYGDKRSWTEIAVMNRLSEDRIFSAGEEISFAPKDLNDYSRKNWIVARPAGEDTDFLYNDVTKDLAALEESAEAKPEAQQASAGIGGFIKQNWLLFGAAFLVALSALFFLVVLPKRDNF